MSGFEYLKWVLENNDELVEEVNSLDENNIIELTGLICELIDNYVNEVSEDE